jgi:hypothetical protein
VVAVLLSSTVTSTSALNRALRIRSETPAGAAGLDAAARDLRAATRASAGLFLEMASAAETEGLTGAVAERRARFRAALNDTLARQATHPAGERLAALVEATRQHVADMRRELAAAAAQEGVYVQVGAWVTSSSGSRAVHIPGFDDYPEGERFVVERWNLALTDAQREQLKTATQVASDINQHGLGAAAGQLVPELLKQALGSALATLEETRQAVEAFRARTGGGTQELKAQLEEVKAALDQLLAQVRTLRDKYASPRPGSSPVAFIDGAASDLQGLVASVRALVDRLGALGSAAEAQAKAGVVAARDLAATLGRAQKALKADILDDVAALAGMLGLSRVAQATADFSAEVRKLDLKDLPENGQLDLVMTGRRQAGDDVVIKLAMGTATTPRRELVNRRVSMARVLLHIDTAVSVIFASPLHGSTALRGAFQAAPSYSALLRWGSRTSPSINNVFTPGFGLNVTALNFRHEDTPELGVGLVVSVLHDYLQAGVGYNVFADRFYGFFGLGLPVPTLGVVPSMAQPGPARAGSP